MHVRGEGRGLRLVYDILLSCLHRDKLQSWHWADQQEWQSRIRNLEELLRGREELLSLEQSHSINY